MTIRNTSESGQSALLTVMMVSIVTTSMAYFALSRNYAARKFVVNTSAKARASEAIEAAAGYLYRVYTDEAACDPGLLMAAGAMAPIALSPSKKFRGYVMGFSTPNITAGAQLYNPPYDKANMDYYLVDFGPIYTLERTDLDAASVKQDILYYEGEAGNGELKVVYLGAHPDSLYPTARSPVNNPGDVFDFNKISAINAKSLGPRDMSIELSVAYPPGPRAQFTMRQNVVFHNTCSMAAHQNNADRYNGSFYPINDNFLGTGYPLRKCEAAMGNLLYMGSISSAGVVRSSTQIDTFRSYLKTGAFETSLLSSDQAHNCADINRDGLVTDTDLGLLEKHLSGYLFYIPPVFPEYRGGTDLTHQTR